MLTENGIDLFKANKLLSINKMLTQSLQLDEILHSVIQAASELVQVADVVIIYLYDEDSRTLRFAKGVGVNDEALALIAFTEQESISGKVFANQQSKLFTSQVEINNYMENMTEENERYYAEGVYQQQVKSTFCVPIVNKDRSVGVVVVNNYNQDSVFTEEDMHVIEIVADQSAIAIDNANVYEALQLKNQLLEKSIEIHSTFYRLIIEGRGIENVLSLLERMIGSSVKFKSAFETSHHNYDFPIQRGNDTLGYLELTKSFNSFSNMEQMTIEQASLSIALELVKENALYEKEIHFREQIFTSLIEGIPGAELDYALDYVKWRKDTSVHCLILEGTHGPLWDAQTLVSKEQLIKKIELRLKAERLDPLIFTRAFQLVIIIPTSRETPIQQVVERIQRLKHCEKDVHYGIGRETPVRELSLSFKEAVRSIGYAKQHKKTVVEYSMLGVERLLYEVDRDLLDRFMEDKLHRLQEVESSVSETLQLFVQSNKNHKLTAAQLHIHPNTLYYRLKKVEEVLGIDFNNEKDWIDLVIAYRIYVEKHED